MLGTEFQDMLRCIRCGACMNHCPVYHAVGGHAYGWVYPGPMGAVLTPSLIGVDKAGHLPNASTFCGRCESVCPMRIPLPKMMRHWREREFERGLTPATQRYGLRLWAFFARRPALYRAATSLAMPILGLLGRGKGRFGYLPLAGGWTEVPRHAGAGRARPSCSRCAAASRPRRAPGMSARDAILNKVRGALKPQGGDERRGAALVAERLSKAPKGVIPARGQLPDAERIALFCGDGRKARRPRSSGWARTTTVPKAVAAYLRAAQPARLVPHGRRQPAGRDAVARASARCEIRHGRLGRQRRGRLEPCRRRRSPRPARWSWCRAATIRRRSTSCPSIISSWSTQPTSPATSRRCWAKIRTRYGKGKMPRTVNLISGPSRSGDVEQKIILGAHGPRALHIIVVGG